MNNKFNYTAVVEKDFQFQIVNVKAGEDLLLEVLDIQTGQRWSCLISDYWPFFYWRLKRKIKKSIKILKVLRPHINYINTKHEPLN